MPESDRLQALTERERRYLRLVLAHRTSKEIAREEGLSKHTVDLHIHRAVRKLGARSRREAALIAAGDTPPIESEYDPPSLEVDGVLGKSPFQHAGAAHDSQPEDVSRDSWFRRLSAWGRIGMILAIAFGLTVAVAILLPGVSLLLDAFQGWLERMPAR